MSTAQSIVFVVDDDFSMRESLRSLLRSAGHEVRIFESSQDFLLAERPDSPGCLVLDVRLPGQSGLELQRQLSTLGFDIPIVFITGHGDIPMSVTAMKAGAIEFLTKPFRNQALLEAVQRGIELDREQRLEWATLSDLQERYDSLTQRERQIMGLVTAGWLNKQIAAELDLSEIMVKVHRAHVMRKMQAKSLPELVRFDVRLSPNSSRL